MAKLAHFDHLGYEEIPDGVGQGQAIDDGYPLRLKNGRPQLGENKHHHHNKKGAVEGIPDVGQLVL